VYLFATSSEAFDDGPTELDGEWRLRGLGASNGVAGAGGTSHGLWTAECTCGEDQASMMSKKSRLWMAVDAVSFEHL